MAGNVGSRAAVLDQLRARLDRLERLVREAPVSVPQAASPAAGAPLQTAGEPAVPPAARGDLQATSRLSARR
jgi:hypothetical protein